ncbi:MAG TPA: GtrA family protein [Bacilli bacterium]|nr:GtrA family protein [Bacilli bacterium]HOH58484.1 GtrA family protein [Bacilli bacterium]
MESEKRKEVIRIIKFTIFSISAGIIQLVSFTILSELFDITYWPSYLTALILSVLWNFTINRKFTFKSANNVPIAMTKVLVYYAIFTPLSTWWGDALTKANWNEYLVLGGTMIINFVTEFLYQRFFVFGKSIESAVPNKEA